MKTLFAVALLIACCGCRQVNRSHGDFTGVKSAGLVTDALNAMLFAYPPAKTKLTLLHPAEDAFGVGLTEALRGNGYAVTEYAPPARGFRKTATPPADNLGFAYVLDLPVEDELRLTLRIGDESLSRLYRIEGEGEATQYVPQGFWSRKQ